MGRKHMDCVHNKRLNCEVCGKLESNKRELNRHYCTNHPLYAVEHNIPIEEAQCPLCDRLFRRRDQMLRHYRSCLAAATMDNSI